MAGLDEMHRAAVSAIVPGCTSARAQRQRAAPFHPPEQASKTRQGKARCIVVPKHSHQEQPPSFNSKKVADHAIPLEA
ncbi:hypothetical protein BU24DRAFT_460636 [Aaosphaeria arxii CBS 175.79]|uniref:Uncharacterized protein n=1 Tax=Aaosphaeria arxii CBS 175.79 TaxID=1450172 RepID=A0A6A5XZB7_9PLEO|nr:uncharacterized protein BU24DRAFT_460636 [Aaosphaeria arxii CBS 175.79]KAF2017614.1 hypothetical protein BU24DRAFT_460636 [Aaosphaeria arxii CBS 175.79]